MLPRSAHSNRPRNVPCLEFLRKPRTPLRLVPRYGLHRLQSTLEASVGCCIDRRHPQHDIFLRHVTARAVRGGTQATVSGKHAPGSGPGT